MMQVSEIPLLETGYIGGLTRLYLQENEALRNFYSYPFSFKGLEQAIKNRQQHEPDRQLLYEVLHAQHKPYFHDFPALSQSVERLLKHTTFTITTGHQLCTATGPLYVIYKIASVINLCKKMASRHPSYSFVPVFWMASEDHDFEEINHINLFNKKITWQTTEQGSTGRLPTKDSLPFFHSLREILGPLINDTELFEMIERAYLNNTSLANASREMILHLFAGEDLLVLDADDQQLKNSFKQVIKNDIAEKISFHQVSQTIDNMVASGLVKEEKIQVKPREINFFYLKDQLRKRIVWEHHQYKVMETDIVFDEAALHQEINQFPERFSPNVVMRPVYQEFILPNICYVGGAGELSYWFELKSSFEAHQVFFPVLALRKSFLWIDRKQADKLSSLQISSEELFRPAEELVQKILHNAGVTALDLENEKALAHTLFEALKHKISAIDVTLEASAGVEYQKLLKSIEMLEHKAEKAQKNKHEISINQLKKIKETLFPEGGLQERYDNILWLNAKFGKGLIQQIISLSDIEAQRICVVAPGINT
jgi:bacillithiol biosynthesis cysteine-adding enzyme BshC